MSFYRNLILGVQVLSIACSLLFFFGPWSQHLPLSQIEPWGNTMTMGLIFAGFICHLQAKKGKVNPALLCLLGVAAPIYAFLGGPARHLVGYHIVAFGFHALALKSLYKFEAGNNA